jgi:hypothetical protein
MALSFTSTIPVSGVALYTYDNLDTADTSPTVINPGGTEPIAGSMQVIGTFGGGTVKLQGSNNGANWVDLKDSYGTAIGLTSAGGVEFSTSFLYLRPLVTGGSSDDVDVFIVTRG